jgi:hypothetical protein
MQINKTRRPREFPKVVAVSRGCFTHEVQVTHGKKGVALYIYTEQQLTTHNSLKSKAKLSVCGRKRKRAPPTPFVRIRLATWSQRTQSGRQHAGRQAAHLSIPTRGVCAILSLSQSSPLIPSSNSALCARAGVEIGGNEHRASGGKQRRKDDERKLVAGWHCDWGHRGWNAAATAAADSLTHTASERAGSAALAVTSQPPGRCLALTSPC